MKSSPCTGQLRSFIGEVVDYHRSCNFQHTGPIVFTINMAAFALPEHSVDEVATCIKGLAADGALTILKDEPLSFTPKAQWGHA